MEKEFVPYELAVKLKALDYPQDDYFSWYNGNGKLQWDFEYDEEDFSKSCCSAPLFQQTFRWFREKYHIHGEPFYKGGLTKQTSWYDYKIYSTIDWINTNPKQQWKTYEEAEIACLDRLIEIVESKSE
jgi:hypothetical protein